MTDDQLKRWVAIKKRLREKTQWFLALGIPTPERMETQRQRVAEAQREQDAIEREGSSIFGRGDFAVYGGEEAPALSVTWFASIM